MELDIYCIAHNAALFAYLLRNIFSQNYAYKLFLPIQNISIHLCDLNLGGLLSFVEPHLQGLALIMIILELFLYLNTYVNWNQYPCFSFFQKLARM